MILSVCMARMNVRPCMDKICAMFEKLKNLAGQHIGVNSFQYLTIAAVAIYRCYFLPENAIMVVPRPGNDMHSNQQIAWFNEVMCTQHITISHALTGRRLGAGEAHVPIEPRDPRKKTLEVQLRDGGIHVPIKTHTLHHKKKCQFKVDGYRMPSKTAYENHCGFWHGCPIVTNKT